MKLNIICFTLLLILYCLNATCQELTWEWASFATSKESNRVFSNVGCGYHNIIYAICEYDSTIYVGDTVLRHPEFQDGTPVNSAVILYNTSGEFISLIDLYTIPNGLIFNTSTGVDESENLNIFGSFQKKVFIQDTMINHSYTPYLDQPDIMVVQLNKNHEINWIRTVGGTLSDQVLSQAVLKNGDMYIHSDHVASSSPTCVIDFFQQDTIVATHGFNAISKLNHAGILEWRNEVAGHFYISRIFLGNDSLFYFWGVAHSNVTINNDTTIFSENPLAYIPFIYCFDTNGILKRAEFADFPLHPLGLSVDPNHNFYISAYVQDTLIIELDTTIVPPDHYYRFIGKFDSEYRPIWYHIIHETANQQLGPIGFTPYENDLVFASYANKNVQIGDSMIVITGNKRAFVGIFNQVGEIKALTVSNITGEFPSANVSIDRCGDILLAGNFRGEIYLENDTTGSYYPSRFDAIIAKIDRFEPAELDMGPDTTGCKEYLLVCPPGYQEYSLNDSLFFQSSILIKETGNYVFGCSDHGCWAYDTLYIDIHPGVSVDIGHDTSMFIKDSITLCVPEIFDSIRWFDGSGDFIKTIYGKDYQAGVLPVWVDVFSGPCSASDTLLLEIKSDFGIGESGMLQIRVYPNPFRDELFIETTEAIKRIRIIDYMGIPCFTQEFYNDSERYIIDAQVLEKGIYFLQIYTCNDQIMVAKILKN